MSEIQLGLALSGGAVRGAAHCGVLSVLDDEGIQAHFVAGTSAGAAVGAAYAVGIPPLEIAKMLHGLSWPNVAKFRGFRGLGFYSSSPWAEFLDAKLGHATFADIDLDLVAVSCDLMSGKRVLISEGGLAQAVRASTAIPALFAPVERDEMLLIDGGTIDNYPVTVPFQRGADAVVGVNVSAQKRLTAPSNPFAVALAAAEIRGRTTGPDLATVSLVPDVSDFSSFEFEAVPEIYKRGRQAALDALPEIQAAAEAGDPRRRSSLD